MSRRRPQEVIHHSDERRQYTSIAFGQRRKGACVRASMSWEAGCYDSSMAEPVFAMLEYEPLDRVCFQTPSEAHIAVFEFI